MSTPAPANTTPTPNETALALAKEAADALHAVTDVPSRLDWLFDRLRDAGIRELVPVRNAVTAYAEQVAVMYPESYGSAYKNQAIGQIPYDLCEPSKTQVSEPVVAAATPSTPNETARALVQQAVSAITRPSDAPLQLFWLFDHLRAAGIYDFAFRQAVSAFTYEANRVAPGALDALEVTKYQYSGVADPPPELADAVRAEQQAKEAHSLTFKAAKSINNKFDVAKRLWWLFERLREAGIYGDPVREAVVEYVKEAFYQLRDKHVPSFEDALGTDQALRQIPDDLLAPPPMEGMEHIESLSALMARDIPPTQWAVPGVFPAGVSILAGKAKTGKSWLLLGVALAVGSGTTALGSIPTEQAGVLYLALEDTARRMQTRVRMVWDAERNGPLPDSVDIAYEWPRLDTKEPTRSGDTRLDEYLNSHPACHLVIIDTFAKIRPISHTKGGPSYDEDYAAIGLLKKVADRHGVALVLCHHQRKGEAEDAVDTVTGSVGLTGAVDSILVLQRRNDEVGRKQATLYLRGRDVEEAEFVLAWDGEHCRWSRDDTMTPAETRLSANEKRVVALLRERGPMRPKALAALMPNTGEANVRHLLIRMQEKRLVYKAVDGTYVLMETLDVPIGLGAKAA